ncbi:MAG: RNA polymerase sigma factor [Nannocystaceae bacterium]|nr:sigma-70 family RNA polymerase sigma factor [bacterium]
MTDDHDLLERWRSGDTSAGEKLLRRHFRSVYAFFANKIAGPPDDLIQETFRACVESRSNIRDGSSFRAYILAIARRELYRTYRQRAVVQEFDPSRVSVSQLVASPTAIIAKDQNQRFLLQALRSLPLDFQLALELTYWEQLPAHEAAEVLDIPVGTLKSRIRRAKEALREIFANLADGGGVDLATADDLDRWAASIREELDARNARDT